MSFGCSLACCLLSNRSKRGDGSLDSTNIALVELDFWFLGWFDWKGHLFQCASSNLNLIHDEFNTVSKADIEEIIL
jgi:hypothetical protein